MAEAGELIEFRRAFVWLLCGMLLPSVALVAFGVVAVANERAAVERRLAEDYAVRLRALERDLLDERLARVAAAVAGTPISPDPLIASVRPLSEPPEPALFDVARRVSAMPTGGFAPAEADPSTGDRRPALLVRAMSPTGPRTLLVTLDVVKLAEEVPQLAVRRYPRERARFLLLPLRQPVAGLSALKRIVQEVAPGGGTSIVARLALGPPLEGYELVAELPGDDPAAALALRNRSLYIALLSLLYTGIGVGFGLTIREMRRAYKLSRLKTDFVANISHELRTPLTSVRLFAETLKANRITDPAELNEVHGLLAAESERLSNLVEKLLDWSRLESGRRVLQREKTTVSQLLERVQSAFRAYQLDAVYETEIEPGLPVLDVDRDAMAQVVLNLLHNAVKYTGAVKKIRLRARRAGDAVAMEVIDNGPGVRPQDRKRIFERFYRADDLLSRRTEGTGLGLAISKRIVEAHGGKIELDSRLGEGSTFRVLLPVT